MLSQNARRIPPTLLILLGGGLVTLGALGLGLTMWFLGVDPTKWAIITGGSVISGSIITTILGAALVLGLILTGTARRLKSE